MAWYSLAVLAQRAFDRVLGLVLQVGVERGAHHEHALGHRFREGVDQLLHLVEGPVEIIIGARSSRRSTGVAGLRRAPNTWPSVMNAGFDQVVEHDVGARARGRQIDVRRELGRRLEQAGEHRGFRQVHVARRLVEVILRGRIDAEGAAAHIGAVEIQLEDLVLGQPRFQPHRQERLLDLALDRALVGQKQVLGELLGDGGAALHDAAGARIGDQRARGAGDIDAEMLVEAPVLGREHRLDQVVGKLVERDRIVVPDAARADLVAVAVEEGDRELGLLQPVVVRGFAERRDRQRQHQHQRRRCRAWRLRRPARSARAASRRRGSGP